MAGIVRGPKFFSVPLRHKTRKGKALSAHNSTFFSYQNKNFTQSEIFCVPLQKSAQLPFLNHLINEEKNRLEGVYKSLFLEIPFLVLARVEYSFEFKVTF